MSGWRLKSLLQGLFNYFYRVETASTGETEKALRRIAYSVEMRALMGGKSAINSNFCSRTGIQSYIPHIQVSTLTTGLSVPSRGGLLPPAAILLI